LARSGKPPTFPGSGYNDLPFCGGGRINRRCGYVVFPVPHDRGVSPGQYGLLVYCDEKTIGKAFKVFPFIGMEKILHFGGEPSKIGHYQIFYYTLDIFMGQMVIKTDRC